MWKLKGKIVNIFIYFYYMTDVDFTFYRLWTLD